MFTCITAQVTYGKFMDTSEDSSIATVQTTADEIQHYSDSVQSAMNGVDVNQLGD